MALNTIADLSTTAGSNTDVLGQNASGSGSANTIDTLFQNLMALMARAYGDQGGLGTVGGSANAITLTSLSTYQALESGLTLAFKAASANSGATTLNLDGLGAKAVRRQGDSALSANDIIANGRYLIQYDEAYNGAAGAWVLLNPATGYTPGGTDVALADGGTGASLSDPNADRLMFWDDSAGTMAWLEVSTGLNLTGTTLTATNGMTLLGTLTTTSGTTQSLTGIAAGYRRLYIEVDGVSFGTAAGLQIALSSTNGAAYGTAANISSALSAASGALHGSIFVDGIWSTVAAGKIATSTLTEAGTNRGTTATVSTNTAAAVNAVQFTVTGGGSFDAGTIRIYGEL